MACEPLIADDFVFPRRAANRAALPRFGYRIGRYADFVEFMRRRIDAAPELAAWTHRESDDPAVALLEGAALLGDILGFYQEHYANEAFLRTARWRDSVAELVRLTGYRLAPGLGGRATFAFEVRGEAPVTLRAGLPLKAELRDVAAPAEFQTIAELTAWPHLGRFHLFRERLPRWVIEGGQSQFEIALAGAAGDSLTLEALPLKKGDRLLLLPEESLLGLFIQLLLGWNVQQQPAEEIVVVERVERTRGRVVVTLAGALTHGWLVGCRAFVLGRSFGHFGAAAPLQLITVDTSTSPPSTSASATLFGRWLGQDTALGSAYSPIGGAQFGIDQEVGDLAAGGHAVVTGRLAGVLPFAVARRVRGVRATVPRWGNLSAPATLLDLDATLAPAWALPYAPAADIRSLRLHETKGPPLRLRPLPGFAGTAFADGKDALRFYGTAAQAKTLAGRALYLSHADGRSVELTCTNVADDFVASLPTDPPKMWPLCFDRAPAPFTRADFDEAAPAVTVYGNLVDATQGKAERDAVLGNGDATMAFQTFALPKSPLTWLFDAAATPPQVPELELRVGGRLWTRVDAFYGRGAKDEVYIVREDAEGRAFVQFGDGETGARLPSGVGNVVARYRSGSGGRGPIKPGATPSAAERPVGLDKVSLAGIVSGGSDPEDLEKAREAAPGKVQSLGRLVSLRDQETETLAIPGVITASASWDLHDGVPAVLLRVLLEAGREAEFDAVRAAVAHAQRCRGPDRHPVLVGQALLRYLFLDLRYARDPTFRAEDVAAGLRAALGLAGDATNERSGLFGLRARRLGEREYASRIEGRLQNVAGVSWCQVTALGRLRAGIVDPATLALPAPPRRRRKTLPCRAHELLQLHPAHLTLAEVDEPSAGECP